MSDGGLTATYCCAGASSTVHADTAVSSDKHYVELMLAVCTGAQGPDTWTEAGIAIALGNRKQLPGAALQDSTRTSCTAGSRMQGARLAHGDILMMAIDMDKGYFYWGTNGVWQNGDLSQDNGEPLTLDSAYRPYVNISASSRSTDKDRWIANFVGSPLKFQLPPGYGTYGTTSSRMSASLTPFSSNKISQ